MAKKKSTTTRKTTKKKAASRSTSSTKTKKAATTSAAAKTTKAPKSKSTTGSKVRDVMSSTIGVCHPHSSLADAAQIMWKRDCGFVPVVGMATNTIQGVITDRDIAMSAAIHGQSLHQVQVHSAMSHTVQTIKETDSLTAAHKAMREYQIYRLPVVDKDDHVVGVLSLNDLARTAASAKSTASSRDVAVTLGTISQPHPVKMPLKAKAPAKKKAAGKSNQAGQGQLI